ncbi:hypothetical protein C8Q75DRAFT_57617 [Abortiporus biennis]|nr:hypothetical protein C8Q75DRAFT_57617 [Abortiporus biennis]
MSGPEVTIELVVLGSAASDPPIDEIRFGPHQRRLEVKIQVTIPTMEMTKNTYLMQAWLKKVALQIGVDLKHTQKWHCEFCDKPTREVVQQYRVNMAFYPPKLNVYLHNICDTSSGEYIDFLRAASEMVYGPISGSTAGSAELAASCMFCNDEATAQQPLNRCSRCKLTRYCGAECQKTDWKRHKIFCKLLKDPSRDVKWVWT